MMRQKKYISQTPNNGNRGYSIIYHGQLSLERGIKDLILAMPNVISKIPNVSLTLIGTFRTEKFRKIIKNIIIEYKLEDNININNQIPYENIWDKLNSHAIGIIPFRKNLLTQNNTPTKLFEMMASGLEIVATDLPPTRYFVDDSIHWVPPGDAEYLADSIIHACQSLGDRSKVQKNLQLIAQKYNWDQRQNQYLALFD